MARDSHTWRILYTVRNNVSLLLLAYALAGTAVAIGPIPEDGRLLITFPILFIFSGYSLLFLFRLRSGDLVRDLTYSLVLSLAFVVQGVAIAQLFGNSSLPTLGLVVASTLLLVLKNLSAKRP